MAATIPNCRAYDPAYAYELAVIIDHGMRRMIDEQCDEFFYVTLMNENYAQPSLPEGVEEGSSRGCISALGRQWQGTAGGTVARVGAILNEVQAAAHLLADVTAIESEVFSATSYSELAREAAGVERRNRLGALREPALSHVAAIACRTRAGHRRDRLRARGAAADRAVDPGPLHGAGNRRLWTVREPQGAAALLRGRPPPHRRRRH